MILLDTNVISELMRPTPAPAVLAWFGAQNAMVLHLSAVGEAEQRRGEVMLPGGKRRERLIAELDAMIAEDFAGRPISFPDCQIAATARAHGAAMATRNMVDFEVCGAEVVDHRTHRQGG